MLSHRLAVTVAAAGLLATLALAQLRAPSSAAGEKAKGPDPAAVERARASVKLIDALYKNSVVQITETYVGEKKHVPAARVTQRVFKAMHEGGFHNARLVDASGDPVNEDNKANTPFDEGLRRTVDWYLANREDAEARDH